MFTYMYIYLMNREHQEFTGNFGYDASNGGKLVVEGAVLSTWMTLDWVDRL